MNNNFTISQIKDLIQADELDEELLAHLRQDSRKGVHRLLKSYDQDKLQHQTLIQNHETLLAHERDLWQSGYSLVAGIDEVGRGPLAGPVVAAAVILAQETDNLIGINDSKTLSAQSREKFAEIIKKEAIAYSVVEIVAETIDKDNIYQATQKAMLESVNKLSIKPNFLLVDAMKINTNIPQNSLVKGDQRSLSIAAASIIAKVHRDQLMKDYSRLYPEFNFEANVGYGTKDHLLALEEYGYTPIHRRSFAPIKNMTKKYLGR